MSVSTANIVHHDDDEEVSIAIFLNHERTQSFYSSHHSVHVPLVIDLPSRYRYVSWILKVRKLYGFQAVTGYLAINYLDRFLSSHNLPQTGGWPLQLLSLACLSLATKLEEPLVPSLFDLQVEDTKFMFEGKTIQKMELLVLSVLDWRLQLVTPFTFLNFFSHKLDTSGSLIELLMARSTDIILTQIQEGSTLEYRPSSIAAAAIVCAASELPRLSCVTLDHSQSWCDGLSKENVEECYNLMQQSMTDHTRRIRSIKVIPRFRVTVQINGGESYIDLPSSLPSTPLPSSYNNKRRKLNDNDTSGDDHY